MQLEPDITLIPEHSLVLGWCYVMYDFGLEFFTTGPKHA